MDTLTLFVALGGLAGGFVNGMTGFGTGVSALPFWLHVLQARQAAPLAAICSVVGQLQSLHLVRRHIDWRRSLPFVAGGVLGIPLGTALLKVVPTAPIKLGVGILIVAYSVAMMIGRSPRPLRFGGRWADGAVGWLGGVLGGLIGLSGVLPTIWAGLRGWVKDERRAVFQVFNLSILALSFGTQLASGAAGADWIHLATIALPGTVLGSLCGQALYRRISHGQFEKVILVVLLLMGIFVLAQTIGAAAL
jgi:uncharacterized membrane protein YfcA